MIPIVAIVGKSNSGKTTLIEKLLPELTKRGYRVATVKHHNHELEIDTPGKDSWRHKQAGAHTAFISTPRALGMVHSVDSDMGPVEIRDRFIDDADLVLAEGFKMQSVPKIEVFRSCMHAAPVSAGDDNLLAIASDTDLHIGAPCCGLDDIERLVDIIENQVIKTVRPDIIVRVDGHQITLKPFIHDFMRNALQGMLKALKGCEDARRVEIIITSKN
ncbi:MAG: molybdopterin-guanine dinucleotide biosynthesis protein B [Deltaproteobacteria bacterium]|nr:molybdopterin-guanine dinucleotide biosynthesis protein B [Deltaproteobacteria bacterium]